jgi:hypothetical protein
MGKRVQGTLVRGFVETGLYPFVENGKFQSYSCPVGLNADRVTDRGRAMRLVISHDGSK